MARTIAVSEDAYRILSSLKKPDESFSDVIVRRFRGAPLSSFAGAWTTATPADVRRIKDDLAAMRRLSDEKTAKRLKPRNR